MTTALARVEGLLTADYASIKAWFTVSAWPFIQNFLTNTVEEELVALKPIAEAAVAAVIQDVAVLNSPLGWGAAVVSVVEAMVPQMATAAITVANASLHTAVGAALSNLQAKMAATPQTPAPAPAA
jgi:hypothetical protein